VLQSLPLKASLPAALRRSASLPGRAFTCRQTQVRHQSVPACRTREPL
jgi:hypothetical protein